MCTVETKKSKKKRRQQASSYDYGESLSQIESIGIEKGHKLGLTGKGVRILITDTGFLKIHESLKHLNIVDEIDLIENDNDTQSLPTDDIQNKHGTSVLSVLAGKQEGKIIGPAFESEYLLAKTEDAKNEFISEEDNLIFAIEWGIKNKANIIITSLGYDEFDQEKDGSSLLSKAFDIAFTKFNVVSVIANGNEGELGIDIPADSFYGISVGATDVLNKRRAQFSSIGPTSDGRIKPDVCALGSGVFVASVNTVKSYEKLSGTSFSAPLVAGSVAQLMQKFKNASASAIRDIIVTTASNSNEPNIYTGFGKVDLEKALNSTPINFCSNSSTTLNNCSFHGECVESNNPFCFCEEKYYSTTCNLKKLEENIDCESCKNEEIKFELIIVIDILQILSVICLLITIGLFWCTRITQNSYLVVNKI